MSPKLITKGNRDNTGLTVYRCLALKVDACVSKRSWIARSLPSVSTEAVVAQWLRLSSLGAALPLR